MKYLTSTEMMLIIQREIAKGRLQGWRPAEYFFVRAGEPMRVAMRHIETQKVSMFEIDAVTGITKPVCSCDVRWLTNECSCAA
jgi:hypothetical protein